MVLTLLWENLSVSFKPFLWFLEKFVESDRKCWKLSFFFKGFLQTAAFLEIIHGAIGNLNDLWYHCLVWYLNFDNVVFSPLNFRLGTNWSVASSNAMGREGSFSGCSCSSTSRGFSPHFAAFFFLSLLEFFIILSFCLTGSTVAFCFHHFPGLELIWGKFFPFSFKICFSIGFLDFYCDEMDSGHQIFSSCFELLGSWPILAYIS